MDNPTLGEKNLSVVIPSFRVIRTAIIKDVPTDFAQEDLISFIESSAKVLSIIRLNRKIQSEQGPRLVPSRSIFPYIPKVQICFSCYRFGHIGANSHGKTRCSRCGGLRHADMSECSRVSLPPLCINCKGEHLLTQPSSPKYAKQRQIQILAFEENIPMLEVRSRITMSLSPRQIEKYIFNKDYPSLPALSQDHDHLYPRQVPIRRSGDFRSPTYNPYSVFQCEETAEEWGATAEDPFPLSFATIVRRPPRRPSSLTGRICGHRRMGVGQGGGWEAGIGLRAPFPLLRRTHFVTTHLFREFSYRLINQVICRISATILISPLPIRD